ncbi:putative deoxyribonuclease tatdn3 [Apophysomyces sp. BC1034]|nr:putative deoxyribonuclease tatdn3 [Apophysomyces sp. BC1015]KAG0176002.1 putative deoxyribonuclease tatdn3 [Apophysomyces sp. BC1021]KAG0186368.1 putative deoxyribonuclease tatdn3 [Apophysomyces sp. BC1034]
MIDVHAHINQLNFPLTGSTKTFEHIISGAKKAGVQHIISVSESIHDAPDILSLARDSNGFIWPAVGLHPVQPLSKEDQRERSVSLQDLELFEPLLKDAIIKDEICCVGEVGLDFSLHIISKNEHNSSEASEEHLKDIQRQVFRRQVMVAIDADLPLNVHSRSAGHHALTILYECGAKRVIMHAFDGKVSYAKKAVEAGLKISYFFSVPPSIVRSPQKQALVAAVSLTHLLLESDSPALGPERGVDNEPANILIAAKEIARIKNVTVEDVVGSLKYHGAKRLKFYIV